MKKINLLFPGKMKYTWIILVIFICSAFSLEAQQSGGHTVTGTVVDAANISLIGVSVAIPGTTTGTITDMDGKYTITVPDGKTVLHFSFVGYTPKSVTVGDQSVINITMEEDTKILDEVVVVGYGVQKKSHLTGSIAKLNTEGLEDLPITRVDQALQGKIAGVNIQNVTSEAGVAPQIRVRGIGSISANATPLVVVDGYPVADGLSFVEMADVESIEVLKDAASAAIYGSRAANGVILVTTKGTKINKPKYTFNTYHGVKTPYKLNPIMKYSDYVKMLYQNFADGGVDYVGNSEKSGYVLATQIIGDEVDYQKEALREEAWIHNYQLNVTGGTKELKYFLSANYTSEDGIMKRNIYDKFSFRAKLDANLSKAVSIGINMNPTYSKRERPSNNFTDYTRFYSWVPVRYTAELAEYVSSVGSFRVSEGDYAHPRHFANWKAGSYNGTLPDGTEFTSTANNIVPWSSQNNNPVAILNGDVRSRNEYRMMSNSYININITKDLIFRSTQGVYANYSENNEFIAYGAKKEGEPSVGTYYNQLIIGLLTENTLTYDKTINKDHKLNVMGGYTYQQTNAKYAGIQGTDYASDAITTLDYANTFLKSGTYTKSLPADQLHSVLGRVNYSYQDKYLLSVSFRADESSKLAPGYRWSTFPSVSAGWRISEEKFMKPYPFISNAKLRASFGVTGNNAIEDYAYDNPLYTSNYSLGSGTGALIPGLALGTTLGNNMLGWEKTNETNVGIDLGFLNNRISLSFDYYYSITDQMLFKQPSLSFAGFVDHWNNIGQVRNKGVEIELNTVNVKNKKFQWETTFNLSANKNRLLELGGEAAQYYTGERNEIYAAIVGGPSIQYFGYKTNGVWSQEEVNAFGTGTEADKSRVKMYAVAGGLKIIDQNEDGKIDASDRQVFDANPFPDFTWGITNKLTYRNFDMSFMFQGVQGNEIINGDAFYSENKRFNEHFANNQWVSDSHPGDGRTPNARAGGAMDWMLTDFVVEDGSYIALRDISLGYKLSSKTAKKMHLKSLRIYGSIQNLLYIMSSDYRGINPEYKYNSDIYASPFMDGYQRGAFPLQRAYTLGLQLTF